MKFILGLKKEMTQIFDEKHRAIPVTKVEAGPCFISQIKDIEKDGYKAIQVAFNMKKKGNKAQKGQLKSIEGADFFQYLKEFRLPKEDQTFEKVKVGQEVKVNLFEKGEKVNVSATSKGKGFQGVVKRHGFKGGPASHGHKDQLRMPGSIGATGPAHVFKGTKMPGQTGDQAVSVKNLEIVDIDPEKNLLFVKGAVPGAENSLVLISNFAEFKIPEKAPAAAEAAADKAEKKESAPIKATDSKEKPKEDKSKKKEQPKEEKAEKQESSSAKTKDADKKEEKKAK